MIAAVAPPTANHQALPRRCHSPAESTGSDGRAVRVLPCGPLGAARPAPSGRRRACAETNAGLAAPPSLSIRNNRNNNDRETLPCGAGTSVDHVQSARPPPTKYVEQ